MKTEMTSGLEVYKRMKCDKCGVALTVSNTGGYAPYGIPLFVCKSCYSKLKESEKDLQNTIDEVKE